ncbi:MAG: hypothetical protein ACRDJ9_23705, partial [Dehalococcoidia bacterium]
RARSHNGVVTFELLRRDIARDLADLRGHGRIRAADRLSQTTAQQFCATGLPQYFTGDLTAPFVLVHLNPEQPRGEQPSDLHQGPVPSVAEHMDELRHFGRLHYGADSGRRRRSLFDLKQVRFLRPFEVIDFVAEDTPDARWINLQRSIDQKLQLELIPYQSPTFSTRGLTPAVLEPHYERLLDTVLAAPRQYVIFCGLEFRSLLAPWVTREHVFRLVRKDGTPTAQRYRFSNLLVSSHNGRSMRAGLATSLPTQIRMSAYAAECAARYHADPNDERPSNVQVDLSAAPREDE